MVFSSINRTETRVEIDEGDLLWHELEIFRDLESGRTERILCERVIWYYWNISSADPSQWILLLNIQYMTVYNIEVQQLHQLMRYKNQIINVNVTFYNFVSGLFQHNLTKIICKWKFICSYKEIFLSWWRLNFKFTGWAQTKFTSWQHNQNNKIVWSFFNTHPVNSKFLT